MKIFLAPILSLLLFSDSVKEKNESDKIFLTCYGNNPCKACKSCGYCKYCTSGGTCGVCAPLKKKIESQKSHNPTTESQKPKTPTQDPSIPSQCKAITKKGTRCSRTARSNGYCWQHGG
jgi:hypothetical protein